MRLDRHAYGLRARRVRCLHRAARRRPGSRLLDICRTGARQCHSHRRGARGRRDLASAATRLHGPSWAAMRLLHPRLSDARHRRAGARARYQRRFVAGRVGVHPLPLYRLSGHRRRGASGCCRAAPGGSLSMDPNPPPGRVLGRSVSRLEGPPLLTGRGQFVGDIGFPRQLHMRVVRSPYAHAVLRAVDIAGALAAPGVIAVWVGADIADLPPIDFRDPAAEALRPYRQPLLAQQRLRYVGEPVAAVFATDPYLAEDAAELVMIDADELVPVLAADAAPGNFVPGQSTEALVLRAS